jgi:2-polyprenyl-3-methyl-5-hydroxy-6-metoxy-1,4-benzoquinol methylase
MGSKLVKFELMICNYCGHLQKKLTKKWHLALKNLYEKKYKFLGKHVSIVSNKIVDRNYQVATFINKNLKLSTIGKILDVGCGTGAFLEAFKKKKGKWKIYAHDLTNLNKQIVIRRVKTEKFFTGGVGIIKGKYNIITLNHVVEHLENPTNTLRILSKHLVDNGFLIIRLPNISTVNTDLTILDHCSHFTPKSLENLLIFSGFKVYKFFNNLNPIEIFVVAKKKVDAVVRIKKNVVTQKEINNLKWPIKIINSIKNNKRKNIGIFGVGTASFYLNAALKNKIKFFVDEDPEKINKKYYGKKIYPLNSVPNKSAIFIPIHNEKFAQKIKKRLVKKNKHAEFIVPQ